MTTRPLKLDPAPCLPASVAYDCRDCSRRIERMPMNQRDLVLDVSAIRWPEGVCPMRNPTGEPQ